MSNFLEKEDALLERNESGDLVAITDTLKTKKGESISFIPISRGGIKEIFSLATNNETSKDQDKAIIFKYCINPKFTEIELDTLKPYLVTAIVTCILKNSGLTEPDASKVDEDIKKE